MQEGQILFSLFSLSPPADRRQLTASSVELAQLGREAKSLSGGRSRLVRAAQEHDSRRCPMVSLLMRLTAATAASCAPVHASHALERAEHDT